jgi:hypothetical protein
MSDVFSCRWMVLVFAGLVCLTNCPAGHAADAEPDQAETVDIAQGNYLGEWKLKDGGGGKLTAKIVGQGGGRYHAIFTAYDGSELENETFQFPISGTSVSATKVVFATQVFVGLRLGTFSIRTELEAGQLSGGFSNEKDYVGSMSLKRETTPAPQLGIAPPEGGRKLFDSPDLAAWNLKELPAGAWSFSNGVLRCGPAVAGETRHLAAREPHGDAIVHVEFRLPYMPEARGQERAQSGLWLQGLYEVQLVDSFGVGRTTDNFGEFDDVDAMGALLGQKAPREVPALPPGEWQALDLTFRAPKLDENGKVVQAGELSATLNGVVIHDRTAIELPTSNAPGSGKPAVGLVLEHAGQPVEFRNLWIVELK